jgi:hypothetical protein
LDTELKFIKESIDKTDREKVKFRKQLFIYLFFLFMSVLFWYLIALSKTYNTKIKYPVHFVNYPKGKVLISSNIVDVEFHFQGVGFHLLRHKILSYFSPVKLDLKEFDAQIQATTNPYRYYLVSNTTLFRFNSLFNKLQVNRVEPDTFYFLFTGVVDKKIVIKPNLSLEFEKPFMQKGNTHLIPDCMIISGPQAIIDTLKYISTKPIQIKGINKNVMTSAELEPIKHFIFPEQKVKIHISAEKYTEVIYSIPIESENVPSGYEVKTFPASVTLSFNIALSDFDKVNAYMFRAIVDYNNITTSHPSKLKVILLKSPAMAKNIKFNPRSVDYLVE